MGVLNNKHVPDAVLRADQGTRLAVLQGIMDTDGFLSGGRSVGIDLMNERLAGGVAALVVSLGWKAHRGRKRAMLNGRDVGEVYRLWFTPNLPVFRTSRRPAGMRPGLSSRPTIRTVVSVEPCPVVPTRCVAVDSPSHLYLAGEQMVPTHNSHVASRITGWWLDAHPPGSAFVVSTAPTFDQVRAILWRYIGQMHRKGGLPGRVNQTEWWLGEEMVAFGRKPADTDPAAFQGIHALHVLVVVDEACGVPKDLWDAADSLTSNHPDNCRILAIGNPDDPGSHFAEVCKPDSGWHVIGLSAFDTPNLTGEEVPDHLRKVLVAAEWVEEKRTEWGENSPLYQSKVLGMFPDNAEDTVVRLSKALECQRTPMEPGNPVELGVDVGGGGDETVIRERRGPVAGRVWKDHGTDTMLVVGKVMAAITETGATAVKVDSIGIGQGVADRLEELRREGKHQARVEAVNVGRSSTRPQMFPKLRDQIWWEIGRELTESGGWDLSAVDDATIAQLTAPKYGIDSSGRVKVEDKDDTRKRIGRSPDDADALLLAFYTRGGPAVVHRSARRVGKTPTVRGRGLG